jgi:hypothetical protein
MSGKLKDQRTRLNYGGYWDNDPVITSTELIVSDYDGFTGLYNAEGEPLYKQKHKLGYI